MFTFARRGRLLLLGLAFLAGTVTLVRNAAALEQPLVAELKQLGGKPVVVVTHQVTGKVKFLHFAEGFPVTTATVMGKVSSGGSEGSAAAFLARYATLFGIDNPAKELTVRKSAGDNGRQFIRYQQNYEGLPVIGGELIVHLYNDTVVSVGGKASHVTTLATRPAVSADAARTTALQLVAADYPGATGPLTTTLPLLSIYNPAIFGHSLDSNSLVWQVEVQAVDAAPLKVLVLVDALSGEVVLHFNQIDYVKSRLVYDNNNIRSDALPGSNLQRSEGSAPSGITEVNNVYDYLGDTYDFFATHHGRNSVDNHGLQLVGTVSFCSTDTQDACPYNNAYWDSNRKQMVCGQGECTDDTVGHEITHGIIDDTAELYYYMQSGAINESLADVWGEFIDLVNGKGNDAPAQRWLFSEDSGAIRNMSNPAAFGDPDRMRSAHYACGASDNGGVHSNSGVNNKAAFLMTDGGTFNGKTVTGLGIEKVAKVYYEALTRLLVSASDYEDLYFALKTSCLNLITTGVTTAADCLQVGNALDAVEMNVLPTSCAATEAPVCAAGQNPVTYFFDDFESGSSKWRLAVEQGPDPWSDAAGNIVNSTPYASSGRGHLWGYDNAATSDASVRPAVAVTVPSGAYLHFRHAYDFEFDSNSYYDGGVVEYSINNGGSWNDAAALFTTNGYPRTLAGNTSNPLKGRRAFAGLSNGYISSRLSLAGLAGYNLLFRFRIGTDVDIDATGWFIDDVRLYTCAVADTTAPVVATFSVPAISPGLTVAISAFTATDNIAVTGYYVTASGTAPAAGAAGWSSTPQTSYTVAAAGFWTLYAWAKDAAGNVSLSCTATVTAGACGFAVETSSMTAPPTGLCTSGAASPVIGNGPWTWTCSGSAVQCSSTLLLTPRATAFSGTGGSGTLAVQTAAAWTATSNATWITISSVATSAGGGSVGFMVAQNVSGVARTGTVTTAGATFTIRQAKSEFGDVTDPTHWAHTPIYAINSAGITTGCGGSAYYCPTDPVTREQMATFIVRSLSGEEFTATELPYYSDVAASAWSFRYVQKLKDLGLTTTSGFFDPTAIVTREQMAAYIIRARYGEDFSYTLTPYYSDVASDGWSFKYIQKMKDLGYTTTTGTYGAANPVTREQMAVFLSRAFLGM